MNEFNELLFAFQNRLEKKVKTKSFKLTIELVPATLWYSSLYRILKADWANGEKLCEEMNGRFIVNYIEDRVREIERNAKGLKRLIMLVGRHKPWCRITMAFLPLIIYIIYALLYFAIH